MGRHKLRTPMTFCVAQRWHVRLSLASMLAITVLASGCNDSNAPQQPQVNATHKPALKPTDNAPASSTDSPSSNSGSSNSTSLAPSDGANAKVDGTTLTHEPLACVPGVTHDQFDAFLRPILDQTDPDQTTWQSEVIADQATAQLKAIGKLLEHPDHLSLKTLELIATDACRVGPLRPESDQTQTVFEDQTITVTRGTFEQEARSTSPFTASGRVALLNVLTHLNSAFDPQAPIRTKFKLFRVRQPETIDGQVAEDQVEIETEAYYQSRGTTAQGSGNTQQSLTWICGWKRSANSLKLATIRATRFEETATKQSAPFEELTYTVLGNDRSFQEQMMLGVDHWRGRLEANYGVDPNGNQGIAIADINGDGLEDLYVCQQGGLPNRMYFRQPDGTLKDVSANSGVDWMETCRSALFVDLDNDGDQDLVMAQGWYLMIMANDGTGKFEVLLERRSSANLYSIAAADYDNDGDLDLFFCGRNPARERNQPEGILGTPIPYHDANNGGPNIFLRNDGSAGFTDVTVEVGLDENNRRYSYAASWEDFDNDGDQDLYVANDFGRNNLYRNELDDDGVRRFFDVAAEMGVEDISAGMSVTWGDYNHDGRMDLYVSNMFSSAGNRVAYQRQFRSNSGNRKHFQRHARGNSLFQQTESGFEDVSVDADVTMGRWAWGSKFVDLNNDSWEDLYVANGFITTEDTGDL